MRTRGGMLSSVREVMPSYPNTNVQNIPQVIEKSTTLPAALAQERIAKQLESTQRKEW